MTDNMNSGSVSQPGGYAGPRLAPVITDDDGQVSDAAVADETTEDQELAAKESAKEAKARPAKAAKSHQHSSRK